MPKSYENTSGYMELQRILWRPVKNVFWITGV